MFNKKEWFSTHREEKRLYDIDYRKTYKVRINDVIKNCKILKRYGINLAEFNEMFETQNGQCKICGDVMKPIRTKGYKHACIDHCHITKRVRGLLCDDCNKAIGYLKDDIEILQSAIKYLNGGK